MTNTEDKTLLLLLECGELCHAVSTLVLFSRTKGGSVGCKSCSVVHNHMEGRSVILFCASGLVTCRVALIWELPHPKIPHC